MEELRKEEELLPNEQAQEETFVPRPVWQVWGARVALVIFIVFVILQILGIARGGL